MEKDGSLLVKLDPVLKQRLRHEAVRQRSSMSRLTRRVLSDYLDEAEREASTETFAEWVERVTGSATSGLTTDEIMALTRGE